MFFLLAIHPALPIALVAAGATGAVYLYGRIAGWWNGEKPPAPEPGPRPGPGPSPEPEPEPEPDPEPSPTPKPVISNEHNQGNPPNISGDAAGYDTSQFPKMSAVRQWLVNLGYEVDQVGANAERLLKKNGEVKQFQKDYNRVAAVAGFLEDTYGDTLEDFDHMGSLVTDGTISTMWPPTKGKNTLNAITVAAFLTTDWGEGWQSIVKKSWGAG